MEQDHPADLKGARQRRFWSAEEKRRMVTETFAPGASVSKMAQRYGVNANLLFTWRRQQGKSDTVGELEPSKLLPVTVADAGIAADAREEGLRAGAALWGSPFERSRTPAPRRRRRPLRRHR
jgi:transposase